MFARYDIWYDEFHRIHYHEHVMEKNGRVINVTVMMTFVEVDKGQALLRNCACNYVRNKGQQSAFL